MPLDTEVDLGSGDIVLGGDPAPPPQKGTADPLFRPMSIVAKRSSISATDEILCITRELAQSNDDCSKIDQWSLRILSDLHKGGVIRDLVALTFGACAKSRKT